MWCAFMKRTLRPVSISHKTFYFKILQSLDSRREIGIKNGPIALKVDMHIGSSSADVPVKLQSGAII